MKKQILPFESERFDYAIKSAASVGKDVPFWVSKGDVEIATRKARHAARWELKAEAINPESFSRIAARRATA
jgi:hypothetical protein